MSKPDSYKRIHGKACRECWDFTDGPEDDLCEWCKKTPEEIARITRRDGAIVVIVLLLLFAPLFYQLEWFK